MSSRWPRRGAAAVIVVLASGCGGFNHATARERRLPTPVWARSTPARERVDANVLAKADRLARTSLKGVTSVLVARHGRLIAEHYYGGYGPADRFPVFSITKTFVSCLVGAAIADGYLRSVDERLDEVLPRTESAITIRQLLTMTAGFPRELNFAMTDPVELANRPRVARPGTTFNYDSGSSDLLAAVLQRVTGGLAAYAGRRLFQPLGIHDERWPGVKGGSGLTLRARELLAFGQMYLDGGRWRGRRILPSSWVHASTRTHVRVPLRQGLTAGYGYDWWIDPRSPSAAIAHGYLGQALAIFPGRDTAVVVTSSNEATESGYTLARIIASGLH